MFVAVITKKVVLEPEVPAQEEIPELRDDNGKVVQSFKPAVQAKDAVIEEQVDQVYLEEDVSTVARNLLNDRGITYYKMNVSPTGVMVSTSPVQLSSTRKPAPEREFVSIESDGQEIGGIAVEKG